MRLLAFLASTLVAWLLAEPIAAQTVHFSAAASAPAGITVQVLSTPDDTSPEPVKAVADGWEYSVKPVKGLWRNEPTFLITIPAHTIQDGAIPVDEMTLELPFSFKASPPISKPIEVTIATFSGVSGADRQTIQAMPPFQQFQQILLAQELAIHYAARLGLETPNAFARFVARTWFETIYNAITAQHRPLRVGDELLRRLNDIFSGDSDSLSHFAGAEAQIRQSAWLDQFDMDALLQGSHPACDAAVALVLFLEHFNATNRDDANVMGISDPDAVLAALRGRVSRKCPNADYDVDG